MSLDKSMLIKIICGAALGSFILIFSLFPKPSLITYERAGIESTSIYWQGFKEVGSLSDSDAAYVKREPGSPYLHICYDLSDPAACQRFVIVREEGLFAVLQHWL